MKYFPCSICKLIRGGEVVKPAGGVGCMTSNGTCSYILSLRAEGVITVHSSNLTFSRHGLKYNWIKIAYFIIKIEKSAALAIGLEHQEGHRCLHENRSASKLVKVKISRREVSLGVAILRLLL